MRNLKFEQCLKPNGNIATLNYCEDIIEKVHNKVDEIMDPVGNPYINKVNDIAKRLMLLQDDLKKQNEDYQAYKIEFDNIILEKKELFDTLGIH